MIRGRFRHGDLRKVRDFLGFVELDPSADLDALASSLGRATQAHGVAYRSWRTDFEAYDQRRLVVLSRESQDDLAHAGVRRMLRGPDEKRGGAGLCEALRLGGVPGARWDLWWDAERDWGCWLGLRYAPLVELAVLGVRAMRVA